MKTLFFLKASCGRTNKDFYIRHDFAADDRWVLTYGVAEAPAGEGSGGTMEVDYSNARMGPQYKCPHCGNKNFVRCGKCGNYTCSSEGQTYFKCPHCGNEGEIKGHIERVEAKNAGSGQ
jgi:predicted RNA-binding Zn-ribbon protein involved in translation (DUF1610 family)